MPMRFFAAGVIALAVVGAGAPARADFFGVGRKLGDTLGAHVDTAVDKIDPILANTLSRTDTLLVKHEDRIGNLIGGTIDQVSDKTKQRLDQVDGILEKRLLQVELGVDHVLDHGLDRIDGVARKNLNRIDGILAGRIKQVEKGVANTLKQVDGILDKQLAHVDRTIVSAIDQTDGVLTARLEQVDEIAGRRLGNVDVIATKQRLGLERTITRAAWLVGLIVFVIIVLSSLWKEYLRREDEVGKATRGAARARRVLVILAGPFLRHATVGAIAAALLAFVPERLPMAAGKEQQALTQKHATELEKSLVTLDWTRVRFHASQLEFLEPRESARYQAMAVKANLLRDVLEKPTAFATPAGRVATLARIDALDRLQGGRPDPDARTVRAMILWSSGTTKADELQAATLSARALWSSPRGFTLAPMARLMIQAYLHAPMASSLPNPTPVTSSLSDLPESIEGLRAALQMEIALAPGSPFEGIVTLFHLMRTLDETSGAAYLAMVKAQARVTRSSKNSKDPRDTKQLASAMDARNSAAEEVVKAWTTFDTALMSTPVLIANPSVLGIFRLNDALLTHALWYTTQPETQSWPLPLAALDNTKAEDKRLLLAIAPARAVWARRYLGLWQGPARELVELQEAQRFEDLEQQALLFEASYGEIAPELESETPASPAKAPTQKLMATRLEAVSTAAALGLHEGTGTARVPLAEKLSQGLAGVKEKVEKALGKERSEIDRDLATADADLRDSINKKRRGASKALHKKTKDLLEQLRGNIQGRPTALI